MSYPAPTVANLAAFSGRDATLYTPYATAVLEQAALAFQFATGLTEVPTDPDKAKLAGYAIMELADKLYLQQAYASSSASPFQSETIGSYTYSKGSPSSTLDKATRGVKLGLFWWDLAIAELGVPGITGSVASGSIKVWEDELGVDAEGNKGVITPADEAQSGGSIGFWNANQSYRLG